MPVVVRPKNVGLELGAVPHRDVDVLLDLDPILGLGRFGRFAGRDLLLHGSSPLPCAPNAIRAQGLRLCKGHCRMYHAEPQTSRAVSTTRRSLSISPATSIAFPPMPLENPHCGLNASCSSGTYLLASSMRRLSSSLDSSLPLLVVTRPSTATLPLGKNRSGSNDPARELSYSRK